MTVRKEEFKKYLQSSGVIDALTTVFVQLYQEPVKPVNAVAFVTRHLSELDPDAQLEKQFSAINNSSECKSLLKKYLTRELVDQLKIVVSPLRSTLLDCIRSGLENVDSGVGIYAADPECYVTFAPIFKPIIEDYHLGFQCAAPQPELNWGDAQSLAKLDPDNKYIVSTRIRCGRSLEGFAYHPRLEEEQYFSIMNQLKEALETMDGEHKGTFHVLADMSNEDKETLINEHYLFKEGDRFLASAGALRFWPKGRAIFINEAKTFLVWVNEEDHIRIISMEAGGDVSGIYKRLVDGVTFLSGKLKFARNPIFGWLTFCPTNLGTTIRASVHIRLPNLAKDDVKLKEIAAELRLQIRGSAGEHSESEGGILDVSNKRRLGLTEFDVVQEMHTGISKLIEMEIAAGAAGTGDAPAAADTAGAEGAATG